MATKIGRSATIEIDDNAGFASATAIGKITSGSYSLATDMADETNNDSAGWKEEQPADGQATIEVSGKFDESNSGQDELAAATIAKSTVYVRFRPKVGVGEDEYTFKAHVPDYSVDTETSSVEDFSATFQSTGEVSRNTQT